MGEQDSNYRQVEKLENEAISRRDDTGVSCDTIRRSNEEIGHFRVSLRAGGFSQASFVARRSRILKIRIAPRSANLARIRSAQLMLV